MVKKKLNILLLLLLALLFTSLLGTTSFAKTLTEYEIRNFVYNAGVYNNKVWTETQLQTLANYDFSSWVSTIESNEGRWILTAGNPNWYQIELFSYTGNATNVNKYGVYKSSNRLYVNTSYLTKNVKGVSIFGDVIAWYPSDMYETNFMYTDCNIYNNQTIANATILTSAGTYRPNNSIFDGPYTPVINNFNYAPSSLIPEINLNNSFYFSETAQEILFVYNPFNEDEINEADEVITGYLYDAHNYAYTLFDTYSYDITTKMFQSNHDTWRQENIGDVNADMIDVTFSAYDYGTKLRPDTILHAEFVPSGDFEDVHAFFYIRSPYSNIVNGVLHPDNTFSGDYALIYNNNNNTDKIIDNDNNLYDKMFKISGDKIDEIFTQAMLNIEIESGELAEFEIVKSYLQGEPRRFYYIVEFIYAKFHDIW